MTSSGVGEGVSTGPGGIPDSMGGEISFGLALGFLTLGLGLGLGGAGSAAAIADTSSTDGEGVCSCCCLGNWKSGAMSPEFEGPASTRSSEVAFGASVSFGGRAEEEGSILEKRLNMIGSYRDMERMW